MEQDFLDALSRAGIPPTHKLALDGKLRRYNVQGDKKGRRNGWYRFVRVRDDFAWGAFGCNKRQVSEKWANKDRHEFTKYDQSLIRKRQAEIEKETEELHARVALKANAIWNRLQSCTTHPYGTRKHINLIGLREMHNSLVVPLYIDNYIVSLQFINSDGDKRFLTGGQKKGGYFWIGQDSDVLYIAEGYATAASIHEATGKQVVIAFDANNLVPVAEILRKKLPDIKIIIAADNDQFIKGNIGLSKAQEAADKIGATVVFPKFSPEEKGQPTDWNDWHKIYGIESLREELSGNRKQVSAVVDEDKRWRSKLLEGKEEHPGYPLFDAKSKFNAYLFLENHEIFKGMLAYNIFTDSVLLIKCPAWENSEKFMPRKLIDTDAAMAVRELEIMGIRTSKEVVIDYIHHLAMQHVINPPMKYFESLEWDGHNRLDTWLTYYLGADKQNPEYLRLVGSKWLIGSVSRIYRPGCKFDNVLVLEGKQGIKKTSAFDTLATFHKESYFLEFSGDISNKDSIMLMQGKVIVEMAELASIRKSEIEEMKTFLSRRKDEYRPPYGRNTIERPRFFVFGASTNNTSDDGYLIDPTGSRRYWPVGCNVIDLGALEKDREQLWAEAVYRYKSGERTWLEDDEIDFAKMEQSERQLEDGWQEKIEKYLDGVAETTTSGVCEAIGLITRDLSNVAIGRIKHCLKSAGWKECRLNNDNGRQRAWKRN